MTKRKAKTAAKPARRVPAKAQRANQAVIRSPKASRLRSLAADPLHELSPPKGHIEPKQETPVVRFDLSLATARAYQQSCSKWHRPTCNLRLKSGPRLASVRSPVELLRVLEELTKERIAMFRKYSNEMVRLSMPR